MQNNSHPKKPDLRTIEIRLELPKFEWLEKIFGKTTRQFSKLWQRRIFRIMFVVIFVIAIAGLTLAILAGHPKTQSATNEIQPGTSTSSGALTTGTPEFTTILPAGTSIEQLGGWTRVSPPDRDPVFAYVDYIRDNRLIISQQPLPPSFTSDTEAQVEELARGYNATDTIRVDDLTVYIGTSAKGPQSVIFEKNDLLILIKSSVALTQDDWIGYISSLE